jgi:hypothetical protein
MEKAGSSQMSVPGINIQGVTLHKRAMPIVEKLSVVLELSVIIKDHAFDLHIGTTGLQRVEE